MRSLTKSNLLALLALVGCGISALGQTVLLTEDFEHGGVIPPGWSQEYVTGSLNWVYQKGGNGNKNPATSHSGVYNGLLYTSATGDHQTKLVTPMIDFGTNTAGQLSFWMDTKIYYIYQDVIGVFYKTNATAAWTLIGYYRHDGWIQVTYSLPTPSRTYYIGFEGDASGGYGVLLDDVVVTAVAPPAAPVIQNGSTLPTGTVGTPYSQTLSASGGTAPYAWSLSSGTLPSGLSLSTAGVLSGTPTTAGNASVGISVAGADSMASTNVLSLAINPAPTVMNPNYAFTNFVGQAGYSGSTDSTNSAARFYSPIGVALDSAGNLFIGDSANDTIRMVTPAGAVTTWAGLAGSAGTNDGTGSTARFYNPAGTTVDTNGNIYVADEFRDTIRRIAPGAVVTTLAGRPGSSGSTDGTGSEAQFYQPAGVAVEKATGNIFVADTSASSIRKITPAGVVSTLAGLGFNDGSADGTNSDARFLWPEGLTADGAGNVFVADTGNSTIRKVTPAGVVTTIAGSPGLSGSVDGTGSAARFNFPSGIAVDNAGNLFVVERLNNTIRKVTPAGVVTTLGGLAGVSGSTDEVGLAARFSGPSGIAVDGAGTLYIADTGNNRIVKGTPIAPPGGVIQMAGDSFVVSETNGIATVCVSRSGSTAGPVSCSYTTADGTATAGADYMATNGTLTWLDGETANKFITIPIINDSLLESTETFTVTLSGALVGRFATTTVYIADDDAVTRIIRLVGDLNFGNVIVGQNSNRNITIYNDGNGPLTPSLYNVPSGFSIFVNNALSPIAAGGSNTATITFTPVAAQSYGGNLTVSSDATSGTNTLPLTGAGVNPVPGTVQMNTDKASIGEAAGSITVYAYRAGGSAGALSCNYATADGTAVAGFDYTATSGTLSWADGEMGNKTFVVPIINDSLIEGDETFNVTLTGAAVNLPATTTITIVDNDFVLVQDDFTNAVNSTASATKFDWGGSVVQDGVGDLSFTTSPGVTSWVRSKTNAAPAAGQTLTLQMRAYAYAEGTSPGIVYGDKQPRGLRAGSDANNCVEFYSASRTSVGLRTRNNGAETLLTYALPGSAAVDSMHLYEIAVTTTSAVFKVDGALAGTITSSIPTTALGVYADTYYTGSGNIPIKIDNLLLTITDGIFIGTAPAISAQPTNVTVNVTSNAAFAVSATGTTPLSYQWRKDGADVAEATNAAFTLISVQTNQAGTYSVVITNAWGSITSSVAALAVNRLTQAITFGALTDKRVGDAPFALSGTASSGLTVSYTSSAPGVATVSGNTVTVVGLGDTTITARQAGDTTYLPATDVGQNFHVAAATNVATILIDDAFSGASGATPDATKWDWSGQANQNGSGQLNLSTSTADTSWLKSKAGAALTAGQSLVAQIRAYAYAEGTSPGIVYGDKQPRGLRVGTDANNAIEFYSATRVTVGMRCRKAGVETTATYSLPGGVDSQHDYQISVTTTSAVFKIDGTTAATITSNIPTGTLNLYIDSYDGGGVGNVPVSIDSATLTLNTPPITPPQIATGGSGFGIQTNRFGFNITGTSGATVVVEASTNLMSGWNPIWTNTLNGGAAYFSDPQWTNYRGRFYRTR
jgi:hypothetical protein